MLKSLFLNLSLINLIGYKKKIYFLFLLIFICTLIELVGLSALVPLGLFIIEGNIPDIFQKYFAVDLSKNINVFYFLFCIFGLVSLRFFFIIFTQYMNEKIVRDISISLSNKVLESYFKDFKALKYNNTSLAIKNILSEVELYCKFIKSKIILISEVLISLIILILLFSFEFEKTLVIFFAISILFFIYQNLINKKIKASSKIREKDQKNATQTLLEIFGNFKLIKIFNEESFFTKKFNHLNKNFKKAMYKNSFFQVIPKNLFEYYFVGLIILVLVLNFYFFNKIDEGLISVLIVYLLSFYRIMPSVSKILQSKQAITFSKISEKILFNELLSYEKKEEILEENFKIKNFKNNILIKNLKFNYTNNNNEVEVIKNLNFNIEKGKFIGISGDSGSGKTTLLNILMKFLNYQNGEVQVDGVDLKKIIRNDWFSIISYVPQNIFIHNDSIKNNIVFGNQIYYENKFNEVLKLSNLEGMIQNLVKKENTELEEYGRNISAGQIQRVGIARALYKKPEIIFLDEPTSNLDGNNELQIVKTLKALTPGITVVMISHRDVSLSLCDNIIKL